MVYKVQVLDAKVEPLKQQSAEQFVTLWCVHLLYTVCGCSSS